MSEYQDKTLCWKCRNYANCNWSKGKPVDGWNAEKILIRNNDGLTVRSYRVKDCPDFVQDKVFYATCSSIASIIGENNVRTSHLLNRRRDIIDKMLHKKGYRLRTFEGDKGWYLETIENIQSESLTL